MGAVLEHNADFLDRFKGGFSGILRWEDLDSFWDTLLTNHPEGWYIYAVGETPPVHTARPDELRVFVREVDELLRKEHKESYCGVVYVDDRNKPTFIKIYDPNNLGVVCGSSDSPPLPGWVLSKTQPCEIINALSQTASRRRWWKKLFVKK